MEQAAFKDGVVRIFDVGNTAQAGNMPKKGLTLKETLRYEERSVGVERYNLGLQNGMRIERLMRCPRRKNVAPDDVAIPIDGTQYTIKQVQYPQNVTPLSMDLSLERVVSTYDVD